MPIGIVGLGSCLPEQVVTNQEVAAWIGRPEEWIVRLTGVRERRYAPPGYAVSDLAVPAAEDALAGDTDIRRGLEAVIVGTTTPDQPAPATAALLQHRLGLPGVTAFDLNAACCSFLYGLIVAEGMLGNGHRRGSHVLLVGADLYSNRMNRSDRATVSLFGDGAGAAVIGEVPDGYGILAHLSTTDGGLYDAVGIRGGGSRRPLDEAALGRGEDRVHMRGRTVREWVVPNLRKLVEDVLAAARLGRDDIDRFVFHQANVRMIEDLTGDLGVPASKVPISCDRYGNTGAASIPVTLHLSHRDRPLRRGERVLIAAAGAGISAGAAVLVWY
jgi:3-oxoacyl-[acyl-carrier-protein] synthase-3